MGYKMTMERRQDIGNKVTISILSTVVILLLGVLIRISMASASEAIKCAEIAKVMAYSNTERISVLEAQFYSVNSKLDKIDGNVEDLRDYYDKQDRD